MATFDNDLRKRLTNTVSTISNIHVWMVPMKDVDDQMMGMLESILAPAERQGAQRCLRASDRFQLIVSRGMLRVLLAQYLGVGIEEIAIVTGKNGKPRLFSDGRGDDLGFSISHSRDAIFFAFSEHGEIGIDVEHVSRIHNLDRIIQYFLTPQEVFEFNTLPEEMKIDAFYTYWTRKEAYIKARGLGRGISLQQIGTSFLSSSQSVRDDSVARQDDVKWHVSNIFTLPGYCAAVAINRRFFYFDYYYWPQDRIFLKEALETAVSKEWLAKAACAH